MVTANGSWGLGRGIWRPWEGPIKLSTKLIWWLATGPLRLVGLVGLAGLIGWLMCLLLDGTRCVDGTEADILWCVWNVAEVLPVNWGWIRWWWEGESWWCAGEWWAALASNVWRCHRWWHDMLLCWRGALRHVLLWCLLTVGLCGLLLLLYWLMC